MSIYSYDHEILVRSRTAIRLSLELLRRSEPCVRQHRRNHIGESGGPEIGLYPRDAANAGRSSDESGSGHRGGESSSS